MGLYVYGSLAAGGFSPARSDIDLIVMLQREPDKAAVEQLTQLHESLASSCPAAERLHCLYISAEAGPDPVRLRTYWFGEGWHGKRMTQWQLKVLTQAELMSAGLALCGPWPPPGIAPVLAPEIRAAVREEITGYWSRIARKRKIWLADQWVDHGLIVLPRAEQALITGELITKTEAIGRLAGFGVPDDLSREIRDRRDGRPATLTEAERVDRARLTRTIMRRGVRKLSGLQAPPA